MIETAIGQKFLESAKKIIPGVLRQMVQLEVQFIDAKICVGGQAAPPHDVTGVIGITGDVAGFINLNLDESTAVSAANGMLGSDMTSIGPDVLDAVGELTNVVVGNMKTDLAGAGVKFDISIPSVMTGRQMFSAPHHDIPVSVLLFKSDKGSLSMELVMKEKESS